MPDSKSILFTGSEPGHRWRIYIQDIKGGLPRPISPEGAVGATVSPDGRLITYAESGKRRIRSLNGDSSRVVPGADTLFFAGWASDGRHFFSVVEAGGRLVFHRVDIETGKLTPWKEFRTPDPNGFNTTRLMITPNGEAHAYTWIRQLTDLYLVEGLK